VTFNSHLYRFCFSVAVMGGMLALQVGESKGIGSEMAKGNGYQESIII
ncbi:unnamed protein product, partial [Acidithrix sp. C25]